MKHASVALIFLCLLLAACSGCASNQAVFLQDNVRLDGIPRVFAATRYGYVSAGSLSYPFRPYNGSPEFRIRLDSGQVVSTKEITLELVQSNCTKTELGSRFGGPENSLIYYCPSYDFTFIDRKLVGITAGQYEEPGCHPAFGRADGGPLYELPLTPTQAREVFGKAQREYEYFSW